MAIWPIRTWYDQEPVQSFQLQEVSDNIAFLKNPPFTQICNNSGNVSLENGGSWTCLSWDTPFWDSDQMSDGSSRITFNTPGEYRVRARTALGPHTGDAGWATSSAYPFTAAIAVMQNADGSPVGGDFITGALCVLTKVVPATYLTLSCQARVRMNEGDYLEVFATRQGGPDSVSCNYLLDPAANVLVRGSFSARWLGI